MTIEEYKALVKLLVYVIETMAEATDIDMDDTTINIIASVKGVPVVQESRKLSDILAKAKATIK